MTFVRSFVGFRPPRRYDAVAFTQALIKESATETGVYTTIETKTLSPVDADPSAPATRNFTTDDATLDPAWYKITWRDAAAATFDSDPLFFGLGSSDLTTVDAVRAYLQKNAVDDAQDSIIQSLVTRASLAIKAWTRREFTQTNAELRKVIYCPNHYGLVDLDPFDLRTVSLVRYGTDGTAPSPVTLTADQYRLRPRSKPEGVWTELQLDSSLVLAGPTFYEVELEITGDWGFPAIPDDVEHWCIVQVAQWLRRDVAAFESTFNLDEDRLEHPSALASAVRGGLSAYRRAP